MAKNKPAESTALVAPTKDDQNIIQFAATAAAHSQVAKAYVIDSPLMYGIAAETLSEIRAAEKLVEAEREKIAKPLHQAWTATNKLFKPIADALDIAKRDLGKKMIAFEDIEKARIRAAEEAAQKRRDAEIAEAAAKVAEVTEKLGKGVASLEEFEEARANELVAHVAMPISAVADPVSRGGHGRTTRWVADVDNLGELLIHIGGLLAKGDPTFNNTVDIKVAQLNAFASATQGKAHLPGVTFRQESAISARG